MQRLNLNKVPTKYTKSDTVQYGQNAIAIAKLKAQGVSAEVIHKMFRSGTLGLALSGSTH